MTVAVKTVIDRIRTRTEFFIVFWESFGLLVSDLYFWVWENLCLMGEWSRQFILYSQLFIGLVLHQTGVLLVGNIWERVFVSVWNGELAKAGNFLYTFFSLQGFFKLRFKHPCLLCCFFWIVKQYVGYCRTICIRKWERKEKEILLLKKKFTLLCSES